MLDPYKTLEVSKNASADEIKKAYFKQIKQFPPEREPEKFKTIRSAYEQLKSPDKRAETDVFTLRDAEQEFEFPDEILNSSKMEIDDNDIVQILAEIFTDLNKTNFKDDYSQIEI